MVLQEVRLLNIGNDFCIKKEISVIQYYVVRNNR